MRRLYKFSLFCALLPMITGTAIFLGWLWTGLKILPVLGYVTIWGGTVLFVAGMASLVIFAIKSKKQGRPWKKPFLTVLFLLLVNFPLALGYAYTALRILESYTVVVDNRSDSILTQITFIAPSQKTFRMQDVAPHSMLEKSYLFPGEGRLSYNFIKDGRAYEGILDGYISGIGGCAKMVVDTDGDVAITRGGAEFVNCRFRPRSAAAGK